MAKPTKAGVIRQTLDNQPNKAFTVKELYDAIVAAGITGVIEVQVLGDARVMASTGRALRGKEPNTFVSVNYKAEAITKPAKGTQRAPQATQEAPGATKGRKPTTDTPPVNVIEEPKVAAKRLKASKQGNIGTVITTLEPEKRQAALDNGFVPITGEELVQKVGAAIPKKRMKAGTVTQQDFVVMIEERFGCPPIVKSETNYAHCFQFSQVDCTPYNLDYLDTRQQAISNRKPPQWFWAIVNEVVNVGIYAQEK